MFKTNHGVRMNPKSNIMIIILSLTLISTSSFGFIVNGKIANIKKFPWHVEMGTGACGGVILDNWHILTASHCYCRGGIYAGVSRMKQMIDGMIYSFPKQSNPGIQFIETNKCYRHPNSREVNNYHDLAIIELSQPLLYSEYVQPVRLPKDETESKLLLEESDRNYYFSGAGLSGRTSPEYLQYTDKLKPLPLLYKLESPKTLSHFWRDQNNSLKYLGVEDLELKISNDKNYRKIANNYFIPFYGYEANNAVWGNTGDSGSPMVTIVDGKPVLLGIASWIGAKNGATFFVDISKYLIWIKTTKKNNLKESPRDLEVLNINH